MLPECRFCSGSPSGHYDSRKADDGGPSPYCGWCRQVLGNGMTGEASPGAAGKKLLAPKKRHFALSFHMAISMWAWDAWDYGNHLAILRAVNMKTTP